MHYMFCRVLCRAGHVSELSVVEQVAESSISSSNIYDSYDEYTFKCKEKTTLSTTMAIWKLFQRTK